MTKPILLAFELKSGILAHYEGRIDREVFQETVEMAKKSPDPSIREWCKRGEFALEHGTISSKITGRLKPKRVFFVTYPTDTLAVQHMLTWGEKIDPQSKW